jgi:hypothetical protein
LTGAVGVGRGVVVVVTGTVVDTQGLAVLGWTHSVDVVKPKKGKKKIASFFFPPVPGTLMDDPGFR